METLAEEKPPTAVAVTEADGAATPASLETQHHDQHHDDDQKNERGFLSSVSSLLFWTPAYLKWNPDVPYELSWRLNGLFALIAAVEVANLAYTHPILHLLAQEFNVTGERAAMVPTMVQSGYAAGLLLICPAGDLLPRRPFIISLILLTAIVWLGCTLAKSFTAFMGLHFLIGLFTVTPQLMFPLAVRYAPARHRATMMAVTMSGLTLGVLLARLLAGIVAEFASWRVVFWISFGLQMSLLPAIFLSVPAFPVIGRPPSKTPGKIPSKRSGSFGYEYPRIILRTVAMPFRHPILLQQAANGFLIMSMFTSFWTTLTFQLSSRFHLSTLVIGLFALIGISTILLSPIASRVLLARLHPSGVLVISHVFLIATMFVGTFVGDFSLAGPVIWASLGDLGLSVTAVSNRMAIMGVEPAAQNSVNSAYMVFSFCGQLFGTAVGNKLYAAGGWIHSGAFSIGVIGLSLLFTLVRGPHETGWVGWRGGWEVRLRKIAARQAEAEANQTTTTTTTTPPTPQRSDEDTAVEETEGSEKGHKSC